MRSVALFMNRPHPLPAIFNNRSSGVRWLRAWNHYATPENDIREWSTPSEIVHNLPAAGAFFFLAGSLGCQWSTPELNTYRLREDRGARTLHGHLLWKNRELIYRF
jgi:hypothetical protein